MMRLEVLLVIRLCWVKFGVVVMKIFRCSIWCMWLRLLLMVVFSIVSSLRVVILVLVFVVVMLSVVLWFGVLIWLVMMSRFLFLWWCR